MLITIGYNGGQFNVGSYWGEGVGGFISYDPTDSGCHTPGLHAGTRTQAGIGFADFADMGTAISVTADGFEGEVSVDVNVPPVGSITWDPIKPDEPPHGVLGFGAGAFAGIGATAYSSSCSCGAN